MITNGFWIADDTLPDRVCICYQSQDGLSSILIADIHKCWHSHIEGGSKMIAADIVKALNDAKINPFAWTAMPKEIAE